MMHLVAISLVASSLTFAGIWSPSSAADWNHNNGGAEQVMVAGGHRAVLVEYADATGQGNTRVSISPPSAAQDKISSAAAVAGVAKEATEKVKATVGAKNGRFPAPGEQICDAFGMCNHKISGFTSKAKEKVPETAHQVENEAKEVVDKAKEMGSMGIHRLEESGKKVGEKIKRESEVFVEKFKRTGEEIAKDLSSAREEVVGRAKEVKTTVEDAAKNVKEKGEKGKKDLADIARRAKEVVCDAVAYMVSPELAESLMGMVQLMAFTTAYGIAMWVTFVMSHVMAGALPRQQFGMVQSKLYPVYFKAVTFGIGVSLLGHLFGQKSRPFSHKAEMMQGYNLLGSLLLVLANLLFLEPRAIKVMLERMKLEKEERRGRESFTEPTRFMDTLFADIASPETANTPAKAATAPLHPPSQPPQLPRREQAEGKSKIEKLNNKLKALNSYSSLLNIMTLMGLSWHLVYLSQRLHTNHHR
ncbi:hypothetical protein Ancab_038178 [Ancistrocladus abbreviatus]